jgi:hypothetical protein
MPRVLLFIPSFAIISGSNTGKSLLLQRMALRADSVRVAEFVGIAQVMGTLTLTSRSLKKSAG